MIQFFTGLAALFIAQNFFRPRQHPPRMLRPNCLLTRHPVIFVHGVKNIFTFFDYWNGIVRYLKKHGYDMREPRLAWRGPARRRLPRLRTEILRAAQLTGKVHLIGHSLGGLDLLDLVASDSEILQVTQSLTLVTTPLGGSPWSCLAPPASAISDLRFRFGSQGAQQRSSYHLPPAGLSLGVVTAASPHPLAGAPILLFHRLILSFWLRKTRQPHDGFVTLDAQRKLGSKTLQTFWHFPGDHAQVVGAGPRPVDGKTAHECFLDHCIFLAELEVDSSK